MPFLLLLVLTLTCLEDEWPSLPDWLSPWEGLLVVWVGVLAFVGGAALLTAHLRRRLARSPDQRSRVVRRWHAWRRYHLFALLAFYLLALYALGWGWFVKSYLTLGNRPLPGAELCLLAPFLSALILSWACFYDLERVLYDTAPNEPSSSIPGRWTYVGLQVRHNLLLVVPPLLLLVLQRGLLRLFPGLEDEEFFPLLAGGMVLALFIGIPWLLRLLLGLKPLPEGPLRDRLLAAARRLNFRCSDILIWNTRSAVANAMVTGLVPLLRYVVLTDRLIQDLTPEEVEAVFGHEVGHVKHQHILFYLGFLLVSLVVVAGVWNALLALLASEAVQHLFADHAPALLDWLQTYELAATLPLLALLGTYIFVVFGFVSRRCERQADIYGCRAVSCSYGSCAGHDSDTVPSPRGRSLCATGIRTFIAALEKVGRLNGISRTRPGWLSSWQHSTIARRVDFLQRLCHEPDLEPRFQRHVGRVKWGLLLGLGAILVLLGPDRVWAILQQL
jgi:Zn-dependent protease with chaperone function